MIALKDAAASADGYHGAFGIGVFTAEAFAAAAHPLPLTDNFWDGWLYHTYFDVFAADLLGGGGTNQIPGAFRAEVDSKAMRKLKLNDTITAVIEVAEVGTAEMFAKFDSRVLIKLA